MKKINNFLGNNPLWQVLFVMWVLMTIVNMVMFKLILTFPTPKDKFIMFCGILGLVFGLMFTGLTYLTRKSVEFWEYAGEVEKLIQSATKYEQISAIYNNEFQTLIKKSFGNVHNQELVRLHAIMKTKYEIYSVDN